MHTLILKSDKFYLYNGGKKYSRHGKFFIMTPISKQLEKVLFTLKTVVQCLVKDYNDLKKL
jgi:hypothetical protein